MKTAETEADFKLAANIVSLIIDIAIKQSIKSVSPADQCPAFSDHKVCDELLCKFNHDFNKVYNYSF